MNCLGCSRMNLQTYPKHAAVGFGHCPLDTAGVFNNLRMERQCKSFTPATADVVAARITWDEKRRGGQGGNTGAVGPTVSTI
jgi:hypothetical protein